MKLNDKEVKLVRKLRGLRSRRQKESLLVLTLIVALLLVDMKFGFLHDGYNILIGDGLGWSLVFVLDAFSNLRPDDRLYALLMRYIDSDEEALQQIAEPHSARHADVIDSSS